MADAHSLLAAGDLAGARGALIEVVRSHPQDQRARMFLFQLFAILGEWEKARLQLNTLASLSPEAQMLSAAYGQAIEAEKQRAAVLGGNGPVPVHGQAPEWVHQLAEAIGLFSAGKATKGVESRDRAFEQAGDTPGLIDGQAVDWISNADPRFGPTLEVIIGGRWGLLALEQIARMDSAGVRDLRDLVWYPVEIAMRSGQSVAAFLPARYPGTEMLGTSEQKLARSTDWREGLAGLEGVGQQLFMLSNDQEVGLLSFRKLSFE